jgi:uncharacterized protein YjbI with pentapeptide repeats
VPPARKLLLVVTCVVWLSAPAGTLASTSLDDRKLEQEIRKLELENRDGSGLRGVISAYGPLLTGLAALSAVLATFVTQRQADRRQRASERLQRENEVERRFAERFASVMGDLGADAEASQAGAAVSLLTFLRPEHHRYHQQVRLIALSNLKLAHSDAVHRLLRHTLEAAFRSPQPVEAPELDFSGAMLEGIDLAGINLDGVQLDDAVLRNATFAGGSLRGARGNEGTVLEGAQFARRRSGKESDAASASLFNARLPMARCRGASFQGANLINCHLRGADLRGATFRGAKMQAAHFESADLRGARFEGADVGDAYFLQAQFDEAALRSLGKAIRVDRAHLSPEARSLLSSYTQ